MSSTSTIKTLKGGLSSTGRLALWLRESESAYINQQVLGVFTGVQGNAKSSKLPLCPGAAWKQPSVHDRFPAACRSKSWRDTQAHLASVSSSIGPLPTLGWLRAAEWAVSSRSTVLSQQLPAQHPLPLFL